ncbi:MAG TPA: PD-(D/E)XK nuclease family protein [Euryarchaeota archaeon]|nr:PD-(D/E)XK nuclease family protein [Euryarchaeota archaeon]
MNKNKWYVQDILDKMAQRSLDCYEGKTKVIKESARTLSPSQVNLFIQCPRKWYYRYVMKIPEEETFAQVRGSAVHYVVEHFFDYKMAGAMNLDDIQKALLKRGRMLLEEAWRSNRIDERWPDEGIEHSQEIVDRFVQRIVWQIRDLTRKLGDPVRAWNYVKPSRRELHIKNDELGLQGFIDSVVEKDGMTILVDYKTSTIYKHPHSKDYQRQLMLYALMWEREYGKLPDSVSIDYLLYGQIFAIPVRKELVDDVEVLVKNIRTRMVSEKIDDYPQDETRKFCNWCTYNGICFGGEQ